MIPDVLKMSIRLHLKRVCICVCVVAIIMLAALSGCKRLPSKRTYVIYDCFDTVIILTAYTDDERTFNEACEQVHEGFLYYHRLFDIYNEYEGMNNLALLNRNAGEFVDVEPPVAELLKLGKEYAKLTDGSVNIAMGAVLKLWHECRVEAESGGEARLPDMESLREASLHCDIDDIMIEGEAVKLADPKMSVDVGAIAKGFAVDKLADRLNEYGFAWMLNCGGAVYADGAKPDGSAWSVGIEDPNGDGGFIERLTLSQGALSTSGAYLRKYIVNGREYGHIIDPETLLPANLGSADGSLASVSVLCREKNSAALADAVSTACYILGAERGKSLVQSIKQMEALFVLNDRAPMKTDGFH